MNRILWSCVLLSTLLLSIPARADDDDERGESPFGREQWFVRRRLNRQGQTGSRERLLALQARDRMLAVKNVGFPGQAWQLIGPQPESAEAINISAGRITALAVDPTNAQVVYAGAAEGGVWKTVNGGVNWLPLTDQQASLSIGSIALAPSNNQVIYAGTGEANFNADSYFGVGILKSTDGGTTWAYYEGGFTGSSIGSLAVSPTDSNTLLAAADNGIFRSSDGGMTWANVVSGIVGEAVAFSPVDPNSAWAGVGLPFVQDPAAGVYHSTDGGNTWSLVKNSAIPTTGIGRISIAIAPSNPNFIYVGISGVLSSLRNDPSPNENTTLGVFTSQDGGNTWTANTGVTSGFCAPDCVTYTGNWYNNTLTVSPADPKIVVGGGYSIQGSNDGGVTWTQIGAAYQAIHTDQHALAFSADGTVLYAGNDGGVFVSTTIATPLPFWASTGSTLAIAQFYPGFSIHPTDTTVTIGGTQDNGMQLYSGALNWKWVTCGDGGGTYIEPQSPNVVFVACQSNGLNRSTNSGRFGTFFPAMGGVPSTEIPFVGVVAGDPSDQNTLYWGGNTALWQTRDQAALWTNASSSLNPGQVVAIGVVSADGNTVIFGDDFGEVFCTQTAKTPPIRWTFCGQTLDLTGPISAVVADPLHPGGAYVTAMGYGGSHVLYTSNAGVSWTDLSGDLPDVPADALTVDPETAFLYLGTDVGVFMSADNGGHWQPLGTGLPNTVVTGLQLYQTARILRVSTHGRSMWDLSVPTQAPVLAAGGILNAANYGAVAPGSIAAVFGAQMTDGTVAASGLPLPVTLGGTGLAFGNANAPIFFASAGQVNVQIPWEVPVGPANATLTFELQTSNTTATVAQYAPGLFTYNASGSGQGIIVNLDNTYAAPSGSIKGATPAQPGNYVVIYCTGLGPVTNQPATGVAAPSKPLAHAMGQVTVSIGGVNVTPEFAGLVPGAVGFYQINVQIPQSVSPGDTVPVKVIAGGVTSNTVTMAVQKP